MLMGLMSKMFQLMMLPGTAMRDIMVHNVMTPFMNIFRTRDTERSSDSEEVKGFCNNQYDH